MGFVLTILYFVTAYLGPATVFGPLADFHIALILAALVLLVSLPTVAGSFIWKTPQSLALVGLAFATFLSLLMTGWAGGAVQVFLDFIPNAFAYFLVCLHCNSKKKLQILTFVMLCVCLFVIAHGYDDLRHQPSSSGAGQVPAETDYLLAQTDDSGSWFYRIRGLDFISDPNDLAQVIACIAPLIFIFWQPKRILKNIAFVVVPLSALMFGAYLTHSRGSVLAILAMVLIATRRRIGTLPSLLLAIVLFGAVSATNYTGGRAISAGSGTDRMDLWSEGLDLLKSHPLFGVGYNRMPDYTSNGLTAHNTVVVCVAELGLFGLFFWSLFLFPTVRDALAIASPRKVSEAKPIEAEKTPFSRAMQKTAEIDKVEVNRLGRLVVLSLTGFLVTGWFLSRAFTMTLFLLGGIVEVVFEMALERGMIAPRMPLTRVLRYAGGLTIALVILVYVVLRFGNLLR
jgi:O-antigen ligase